MQNTAIVQFLLQKMFYIWGLVTSITCFIFPWLEFETIWQTKLEFLQILIQIQIEKIAKFFEYIMKNRWKMDLFHISNERLSLHFRCGHLPLPHYLWSCLGEQSSLNWLFNNTMGSSFLGSFLLQMRLCLWQKRQIKMHFSFHLHALS